MGRKKTKLIHGWGVNDVDYVVYRHEVVEGKKKIVWRCPYYVKWASMIKRCFCPKHHAKQLTYKGCTIAEDWKYLSNFIKWVDSQPNRDWENCELDKDILFEGNKHYSPETVVFVSRKVNGFIVDSGKTRGKYMLGVCDSCSKKSPYQAQCWNTFDSKQKYIGIFPTEIEAHKAWQAHKHEQACKLAEEQTDPRVAQALRERYAPNKDWTKIGE